MSRSSDTTPAERRPFTVLLVDDQPLIEVLVRRCLAAAPEIALEFCADAREALATIGRVDPSLVLLDLIMPARDGMDVLREIRGTPATCALPVIVMSAEDDPILKAQAFEHGAHDYIVKVPAHVELIARVRRHAGAYLTEKERDAALGALRESQKKLHTLNHELRLLSRTDDLTGLPNRRVFDEVLEREWRRARRVGEPLALAMADIDLFKALNDSWGHLSGDRCLREIAAILASNARRPTDCVARYGGEEFAVILPDARLEDAMRICESMRQAVAVRAHPHPGPGSGAVTISIGVSAVVPWGDEGSERLIAAADEALYAAKAAGRNRVLSQRCEATVS